MWCMFHRQHSNKEIVETIVIVPLRSFPRPEDVSPSNKEIVETIVIVPLRAFPRPEHVSPTSLFTLKCLRDNLPLQLVIIGELIGELAYRVKAC
ncbi:hypothetical protein ElyMa_000924800 [Elysia marginata]|uniref:Uncharacterized protein n=1 Tax=Elysia marginata TaxID=1093978 RepID=A0AAV4HAB4_9GAST|nr:hypothetical protein ElyMa_000924800 [Elysia marginata]